MKQVSFRTALKILGAKSIKITRRDDEELATVVGGQSSDVIRQLFKDGEIYSVVYYKNNFHLRERARIQNYGKNCNMDFGIEWALKEAGYILR